MSLVQKTYEDIPWFMRERSLEGWEPRWAIIPTHMGKCDWDPIYSLVPDKIRHRVLALEKNDRFGEIIFYKQIAFLQTDASAFCRRNKPWFLNWRSRKEEIWGDYYYAGYYLILREALRVGCGHIALGAPGNRFRKHEWENFYRACKNARFSLGSDQILEISGIAACNPEFIDEDQEELMPHRDDFFHKEFRDAEGLLHIRFRPAGSEIIV